VRLSLFISLSALMVGVLKRSVRFAAGANLFVDSYFKTETVVSISDSASFDPGSDVS
jgi:hypothetical protein